MSTLVKDQAEGYWELSTSPYKITNTDTVTFTLDTENKFVDADIVIKVKADAAASLSLSLTDLTSNLTMGSASDGVYSPTVSLSGTVSAGTAGWFSSGSVSDSSVGIGKINQSVMQNGGTTISNNTTIVPTSSQQTITITEGYNTARTLIIDSTSSATSAVVTSGSATISSLSYAYDSTTEKFNITGSADVSAPTVETAGYISSGASGLTANTDGAVVSTTVNTISLNSTLSGATTARKPSISKSAISITGVTDAADGSATTTPPSSGVYVSMSSAANTATITSTPTVQSAGYGTTSNFAVNSAATATVGAAASDTTYIPIKVGTITSGSATISSLTYTHDSTNSQFTISGSANVSAPTVGTEGYVSSSVGTKQANNGGATVSTTVAQISIQANLSGTGTKKPSISKDSATNIGIAGAATTTQPSSGYYIAVASAANTGTVQATASVSSAGYGTTTSGQYTTTPSSSLTVGASASDVTYIPLTETTFANAGTSNVTYTDISSSVSALVSGDYLYINEGYTTNQKISLAKLVPDATGTNASAAYVLSGYTAYDNDGGLIVGTMQTYSGSYTIV